MRLTLLSAALLVSFSAAFAQETTTEAPLAPVVLPAITVTTVAEGDISDRIVASGLIGPVEEVVVQPQIEGQQIEALLADVGDRVEAGQALAELSRSTLELRKTQLEAAYASAVAALAQGEAQLTEANSSAAEAVRVRDRTEKLRSEGTVSQAALDQAASAAGSALARVTAAEQGVQAAQAQIALAQAQLADVDLSLDRATVRAPVSGDVTVRNASVGAIATAGAQPMFVVVRDGLLELRADVAEGDVLRLQPDQKVTMRAVGLATPLTGTVRLVEPTVDTVTRLGRVRITLDAPESVRSGMFAEAEILVARRTTLIVPVAAVQFAAEGEFVLKVGDDGVLVQTPVQTGIRDRGLIEITSGLSKGDVIVSRAGAFVRAGDKINPVADQAAAPSN
jgi:HlyD family secretion protein